MESKNRSRGIKDDGIWVAGYKGEGIKREYKVISGIGELIKVLYA